MSEALVLSGLGSVSVSIPMESANRRDIALSSAGRVSKISDAMDAEEAADALRSLTALAKEVEDSRILIKQPILLAGKKIDAIAAEFTAGVLAEKTRIEKILGEYKLEERRKEEEHRIKRIDECDDEIRACEKVSNLLERGIAGAQMQTIKPEGISVRTTWKFEVTDIRKLFYARPDLCIIEPNNPGIRAQIPYNQTIPGLRIWSEAKASIRN